MRVTVDDCVEIKSEALRSERAVSVSEIGLRLEMAGDREDRDRDRLLLLLLS